MADSLYIETIPPYTNLLWQTLLFLGTYYPLGLQSPVSPYKILLPTPSLPAFPQKHELNSTRVPTMRQDMGNLCSLLPALLGTWLPEGAVPADVPMRILRDIQLPAPGHGWRSVCLTKQTLTHRRSLSQSPQLQESQGEVIREDRGMVEVNVLHPSELTIPKPR